MRRRRLSAVSLTDRKGERGKEGTARKRESDRWKKQWAKYSYVLSCTWSALGNIAAACVGHEWCALCASIVKHLSEARTDRDECSKREREREAPRPATLLPSHSPGCYLIRKRIRSRKIVRNSLRLWWSGKWSGQQGRGRGRGQWAGGTARGRGSPAGPGQHTAVCTAHITHSIESRSTHFTLFWKLPKPWLTRQSSRERGSAWPKGCEKDEREGQVASRQAGRSRGICCWNQAFMEHVKLKCIRRHHRRRRRHEGQRKWLFNGAAEVLPSFLSFFLSFFY